MRTYSPLIDDALISAPSKGGWLLFRDPDQVFTAFEIEDVAPVLQQVDRYLQQPDRHAAGFVAYEAAPGLDPVLKTKSLQTFPLVWFGIYREPVLLPSLPDPPICEPQLERLIWSASVTRQDYDRAIAQVKNHIAQGETYQVNYTYRLCSPFQGDPYPVFVELANAQKARYTAFIHTDRFSLCSASPELFFSLDGELLSSKPMKGTAARGRTLQEDQEQAEWLRNSEKDRAENVMIVDMMRNDIGKIARTGSVKVPELFSVEKFPTVWQMTSTVTGHTGAGLYEIFQALFPPASITGAPKASTMEIISLLENSPRRVYTGCIGYAGLKGKAQFNVSIRTLLIDRQKTNAEYGVGGGITWSSEVSAEFEESQAKAKILSVRFPRFSLLESLLWEPGKGYFLLDYHLARLRASAEYFSFPVDILSVERYLAQLEDAFGSQPQKVRLLVNEEGRIRGEAEMIPHFSSLSLNVCVAAKPVNSSDPFLFHKTTNRSVYEKARKSCPTTDGIPWDDVILWNEKGEVTETSTANLVFERAGKLYTPPVSCGLLPGTYRAWLLDQGQIEEKVLPLEGLSDCSRVFLVNSVRGQREARLPTAEPLPSI